VADQVSRGTPGIDLLTPTGHKLLVKAKRGRGRWVLGPEGQRPAADVVAVVSVGEQHGGDEFFLVSSDILYDWVEARHRAYWATRGDVTGETELMQIRDSDADVREFLEPYRDAWAFIT
jgi:hypothetical protein